MLNTHTRRAEMLLVLKMSREMYAEYVENANYSYTIIESCRNLLLNIYI